MRNYNYKDTFLLPTVWCCLVALPTYWLGVVFLFVSRLHISVASAHGFR